MASTATDVKRAPERGSRRGVAHRHPIPRARRRRRAICGQALRRRHRHRLGRHLPRRTRLLRGVIRYRGPGETEWRESEMRRIDAHLGGVRWAGSFEVDTLGAWEYEVEAWTDVFGTWRDELERKVAAGQHDLAGEMSEGALLLSNAAEQREDRRGPRPDRARPARRWRTRRVPENAKHDVALGTRAAGGGRARRRARTGADAARRRCRSRSTASAPASAPGTSCSRARGEGSRASSSRCRAWPSSASTCSTCRRSTRSA